MPNRIAQWFLLERPVLGGKKGVESQFSLFTGVVAGSVGQWLFAALSSGKYVWPGLALGLIASIVTFPLIYYNAGLNKEKLTFVKWCVAFQNGFFWPSLLDQVRQGYQGP